MYKKYLIIFSLFILSIITIAGQNQSATPNQLRVLVDSNGYLLVSESAPIGQNSQPTVFSNTRLKTDSNGYLLVASTGGTGAPTDATYITQTPNTTLTNEQALSLLSTGILKVTTTTGVVSSEATTGITGDLLRGDGTFGKTFAAGTITSNTPFIFSQTWNNGAVQFNPFQINITDTASDSGSKIATFNVGGSPVFDFRKSGLLVLSDINVGVGAFVGSNLQIGVGGTLSISNGVDFSAGFARTTTGIKSGNNSTGYIQHEAQDYRLIPNGTSKPTCDSSTRGTLWYTSSANGVSDAMEVCAKSSLDVYAWRSMATVP